MKLTCLLAFTITVASFGQAVPVEIQIKTAVLAAPVEQRTNASVYGYNDNGDFVIIRKGSNTMVCLADDPSQAGLNVSCYHKDLDPFMARGRELKKEGKAPNETLAIREQEVKAGKLQMPNQPTTLYVYTAAPENFDATTGEVKSGYLRYVIYIPYATAESTGLPTKPDAPGMPWIMDAGTFRAHIMINPPKN